ncbi:MAG TPA: TSUP family transporter, partial [Pseudolabrys sp.]
MSLATSLTIFLSAGLVGGLLLGLIGVGTALISVPFLTIFLPRFGIGPDAAPLTALATSMAIVSVGSISSIASHHRLGNVDFLVSLLVSVPFFVKAVLQSHAPHHDLLAAAAAILTPLGLHAWVPGAACALNCP